MSTTTKGSPYATGQPAGKFESDQAGLTSLPVTRIKESALIHPSHADGLVNEGDPVVFGQDSIPGAAAISADSINDYITIWLGGVHHFAVVGQDENGSHSMGYLDRVYMSTTTGILSANSDPDTQTPFGFIHAPNGVGSGLTTVVPVQIYRA